MRTEVQQRYEVVCLQLEYFAGRVFTLTPSKLREDLRNKVKRYHRECSVPFGMHSCASVAPFSGGINAAPLTLDTA